MKYPAGISNEAYAWMEEGYEQGVAAGRVAALREFAAFIVAPVEEGLDEYTLGEVAKEALHRAEELEGKQ
jgi:hypothetical protein